ncbi:MAG: hypothetical protein QXZ62_08805 [Candidatus Caldarchaeum sp.]
MVEGPASGVEEGPAPGPQPYDAAGSGSASRRHAEPTRPSVWGEGRRFYVDVHMSANGGRGARPHVIFDGHRCVKTAHLVDIPAGEGDEVYLDVIPSTIYDDVSALLSRGVRVFRLRRTDLIAAYRDRLSLSKNDENDATTLSMMDGGCFVEVTAEYVGLMKLIDQYHKQLNILKLLKRFEASAEAVKPIRRNKDRLARQIIRMAKTTLHRYDETCRRDFGKTLPLLSLIKNTYIRE